MKVLSDVVAKEVNVLKVDAPGGGGRGWKRTNAEVDTSSLSNGWRQRISDGAKYVIRETWVKANDPHIDAKVGRRANTIIWKCVFIFVFVLTGMARGSPVRVRISSFRVGKWRREQVHQKQSMSNPELVSQEPTLGARDLDS